MSLSREKRFRFWKHGRWYYFRYNREGEKTLCSENPISTWSENTFAVCHTEQIAGWEKDMLTFTLYPSVNDFIDLLYSLDESEHTFFEIIQGKKPQKPHFDVDVDLERNDGESDEELYQRNENAFKAVFYALIDALREEIPDLVLETDIVFCPSDRRLNAQKVSAHIIVNHWLCANADECAALYRACYARITEALPDLASNIDKILDPGVYGPSQQFRFLGSHKAGKSNVKRFSESWKYREQTVVHDYGFDAIFSERHRFYTQFCEAMVGFTAECTLLPRRLAEGEKVDWRGKERRLASVYSGDGANDADVDAVYGVLSKFFDIDVRSALEIRCTSDEPITLIFERRVPTWCPLCSRDRACFVEHENEHPYAVVLGDGNVFFYCRRAKDASGRDIGQFAGTIPSRKWSGFLARIQHTNNERVKDGIVETTPRPEKVKRDAHETTPRPTKVKRDAHETTPRPTKVKRDAHETTPRPEKVKRDAHETTPRPTKVAVREIAPRPVKEYFEAFPGRDQVRSGLARPRKTVTSSSIWD